MKKEYGIFDRAWQPVLGCNEDLPCVRRCWAKGIVNRLAHSPNPKVREAHAGLVTRHKIRDLDAMGKPAVATMPRRWTGTVRLNEAHLLDPLRWRKPATVATGFHGDWGLLSDAERDRMLAVMALCPHLEFFTLTKRPEELVAYLIRLQGMADNWAPHTVQGKFTSADVLNLKWMHNTFGRGPAFPYHEWPFPNLWLGISASNQAELDARAPHLMKLAAAGWRTFLFLEPLVGPVDLREWISGSDTADDEHWAVVGCESGPDRRPDDHDWYRSLVRQCMDAGVPLWVKQLQINGRVSRNPANWPADLRIREFPDVARFG